ncbi:MAG: hypothetical protein SOX46_03220 [Clostridiaceae bacterium]|nr:hypothetical protein [Clostridiaceae bacterium]
MQVCGGVMGWFFIRYYRVRGAMCGSKMSAVFFTFQAEKIGYFLPFLGVLEQEVKRL